MGSLFGGGGGMEMPAAEAVSAGGMSPGEFSAAPGASGGSIPTQMPPTGGGMPSMGSANEALKLVQALASMSKSPGGMSLTPPSMTPKLARGQPMVPTSKSIPPITAKAHGGNGDFLKVLSMLLNGGGARG